MPDIKLINIKKIKDKIKSLKIPKEYWGIEETELIYAEKLDIEGIDVDEIIDYTCDEIRRSFE